MRYQMDFQKQDWVDKDANIALNQNNISLIPILYILSLKFNVLPISTTLRNKPKPFSIILFVAVESKKRVDNKRLQYHHKFFALPLFSELDPSWVQLKIGDSIYMESLDLYLTRQSKINRLEPVSSLSTTPHMATPKKRKYLTKLENIMAINSLVVSPIKDIQPSAGSVAIMRVAALQCYLVVSGTSILEVWVSCIS